MSGHDSFVVFSEDFEWISHHFVSLDGQMRVQNFAEPQSGAFFPGNKRTFHVDLHWELCDKGIQRFFSRAWVTLPG
jgi:hypothetical protein